MIYRRKDSKKWWLDITRGGRRYQLSTGLTNKRDAKDYEAAFIRNLANGEVGIKSPSNETIADLLDRLLLRWQRDKKATVQNLSLLRRAQRDFGPKMAGELTSEHLDAYVVKRQHEKAAAASINRVIQCIRAAYRLSCMSWPGFQLLSEKDNVRQGRFEPDQMRRVLAELPDDGLMDFVEFAWTTGIRKGELAALRWEWREGSSSIVVPAGACKNKLPHRISLDRDLQDMIRRREAKRAYTLNAVTRLSEYIFHRGDGQPIGDFKKSWKTACKKADVPGRIFHDLRRTAVSDMIEAGVPQSIAMSISGHKTISVFQRYAITSPDAQIEAFEKVKKFRAG
jgi:integrase